MFIFFLILLTAGAQDYASEVLYPDDLIPIEDLEGKTTFQIKFNFHIFIQIKSPPRQYQFHQPQLLQQQQRLLTKKMLDQVIKFDY